MFWCTVDHSGVTVLSNPFKMRIKCWSCKQLHRFVPKSLRCHSQGPLIPLRVRCYFRSLTKEEQTFISARPVKSPFVLISVMPCTMKISESYSLTRLLLLPFEKRSWKRWSYSVVVTESRGRIKRQTGNPFVAWSIPADFISGRDPINRHSDFNRHNKCARDGSPFEAASSFAAPSAPTRWTSRSQRRSRRHDSSLLTTSYN